MTRDTALDSVAEVVAGFGVDARRAREALALLTEGPRTLDELVRRCALPRRSVQALLHAAGPDLDEQATALRPERVVSYRERFGYSQLRDTALADPLAARLAAHSETVRRLHDAIAHAPPARDRLDHVTATAETVLRRALWLDATFDLAGARVLCLGDHDLTSLALAAVRPDADIAVVDLDDELLEYLEARAEIGCLHSDFRLGLAEGATGWADLVLTDPPYTPEGVHLFLGRGLAGLRDRNQGRLVLCYGFSPRHPALGLKVQRAIQDLDLVIEALLPRFNRYHGAQAVGSSSDLYVCRPTSRTWRVFARKLAGTTRIYTRGTQSVESGTGDFSEVLEEVLHGAGNPSLLVGCRWGARGVHTVSVSDLIASGVRAPQPVHAAVDLGEDPGPWLLRVLLALNAERMAVLVPADHPELAQESGLAELIAPKYSLRMHRHGSHAIVQAEAAPARASLARELQLHAHGKVGNIWREHLIRHGPQDPPMTKNDARSMINSTVSRLSWTRERLLDLPRHAIRALTGPAAGTSYR